MNAKRTLLIVALALISSATVFSKDYNIFATDSDLNKPEKWTHPAWVCKLDNVELDNALMQWPMNGQGVVPIVIPGVGSVKANVERFTILDPEFQFVTESDNTTQPKAIPQALLLRGSIAGMPGSHVMLAVFKTWALGYITIHGERHILSPISQTGQSSLMLCSESVMKQTDPWMCHVSDTDEGVTPFNPKKDAEKVQATNRIVRLAVDCDFDYYKDHGSNEYRAAEYALAVFGSVSDIYQRDVNCAIKLTWLGVWVTSDPYTGTTVDMLLPQFRQYMELQRPNINRTAGHLMSGVNSIGGMGNIDRLCTNEGYAVSGTNNTYTYPITGYVWDTDVCSHELGHNVGSRHTHSCTWNPPIDSCYQAESGNCFTQTKGRKGTIMSYCHLTTFGTDLMILTKVADYMNNRMDQRSCLMQPATFNMSAGADIHICKGSSVKLAGVVIGGQPQLQYSWLPNIAITNANTLTPTVNPTQTITYVLEVRDGSGEVKYDSVKVTVSDALAVKFDDDKKTACAFAPIAVTTTTDNPVGAVNYEFRWPYDTVSGANDKITFNSTKADSFKVYVIGTDTRFECVSRDSITIVFYDKPEVSLSGPTVTCPNSVPVIVSNVTGGKAPFTREWRVNNGPFPGNAESIQVPATENANIMLILTDANGCSDTARTAFVVRNLTGTITPTQTTIPPIGACDSSARITVTIRNTGALPYGLDSVYGARVISTPWPVTQIAPNTEVELTVLLENLPLGSITRTIQFVDDQCRQRFTTVATGRRGLVSVTSTLPVVMPAFASCDVSNQRVVSIGILNDASATVDIDSIVSVANPGLFVPARATGFASSRRGNLDVTLTREVPAGTYTDNVVIHYSSVGCTGTMKASIRFVSDPLTTLATDEVEFPDDGGMTVRQKEVTVKGTSDKVAKLTIQAVKVRAPFATTLKAGQSVSMSDTLKGMVTFDPSKAKENVTRDTLVLTFNGCEEETRIPLTGLVTVVGVDEVIENTSLVVDNGRLTISASDAGAYIQFEMLDLSGRLVVRGEGYGSSTSQLPSVSDGVYAISVKINGQPMRSLLSISGGKASVMAR